MSQPWACHYVTRQWRGHAVPVSLVAGVGVHGLLSQQAISLAQAFPQLADGLVRLFLSCAEDPVDPGFEFGRSAF